MKIDRIIEKRKLNPGQRAIDTTYYKSGNNKSMFVLPLIHESDSYICAFVLPPNLNQCMLFFVKMRTNSR